MADIRELYPQRVEAASVAFARGDRAEAERLYAEALVMGEQHFGADDPALAVPLNELSRLYVRRSEHARAEPLLQRLLGVRRASGEHHPDVATVLAGLAAVRRGLGDDAEAEDLYRQALEIRERVHAPDHMAVVVTLEHLADTCVALRKFREASVLIERALAVRVKTLGADHPSVLALRERFTHVAGKAAPIRPSAPIPLPA
ncbi:MAG: tetratricopeptide repeat protein, partial [Gemmatimonadota bacterium]|nr:tetratricopeptide repeat protein [Gemmatimonadota bacterium]